MGGLLYKIKSKRKREKNLKIYENDRTSELHFGNRKLPEQIISKVIILCLAFEKIFRIESEKIFPSRARSVLDVNDRFKSGRSLVKLDGRYLKWPVSS